MFLREIKPHFLGEVLSLNLAERSHTFEVEVSTTFSVYYIRLFIILNDSRAAKDTEKEVNLSNVINCVRQSVLYQYPLKPVQGHSGDLRKATCRLAQGLSKSNPLPIPSKTATLRNTSIE